MPWKHCENEGILDDVPCPTCAVTKEAWTLEFNVTRTFKVKRRATLRVVLLDDQEAGVAAEPYRIEMPDGEVREGELNEEGLVKVTHGQQGDCTICFTARAPETVVPYVPPEEEDEEEASASPAPAEEPTQEPAEEPAEASASEEDSDSEEEAPAEEPPTFTRPANRRHTFQLAVVPVLQLTLFDELGQDPLRFVSYSLEASEGTRFEGTSDGAGRIDHGVVVPPFFTLSLTVERADETYEASCAAPAVLSPDAWSELWVPGIPPADHDPHEYEIVEVADLSLFVEAPDGTPLAEARYELTFADDETRTGTTDEEGLLEEDLPEGLERAHLRVWQGKVLALEVDLQLGEPEPLEEIAGGQARLANLGYFPGALDGELGPKLENALQSFQKANQLQVSGEYDEATRTKLGELSH